MGLKVDYPNNEIETLMWGLYLKYEDFLQLNEPLDPVINLKKLEQIVLPDVPTIVIESAEMLHVFKLNIDLKNKRQVPPNLNINLNLQFPPSLDPKTLSQQSQQILNKMMEQISLLAPQLVQQEIIRQSPLIGFDASVSSII